MKWEKISNASGCKDYVVNQPTNLQLWYLCGQLLQGHGEGRRETTGHHGLQQLLHISAQGPLHPPGHQTHAHIHRRLNHSFLAGRVLRVGEG